MEHYELIVIGAGPAGTPAATAAAQFGKKVLLVDKRGEPGGECLFEGCIPSKVFENAANRYAIFKEAQNFHIELKSSVQIHWEEVLRDKEEIIHRRSKAALMMIEKIPTLTFKKGKAKFVDAHTIELDAQHYSFDKALIATGAKVNIPPFTGNGVKKAWTNRDIFFEEEIPKELLFVGAGTISCELAQMFNKLGTKCTVLERNNRILQHVDKDVAEVIEQKMIDSGIQIELNVSITSIDYYENLFNIHFSQNGEIRRLQRERVLLATGRNANIDTLKLENAKVPYDRNGVKVNDLLQSSQPHIFACGDCIDTPHFAHTASYEAGVVIHNMFAPHPRKVDYDKNSWVLFSDPQAASVGLGEEEAKKRGIDVIVSSYDFSIDARAQIDKEELGFVKFIIDKKSRVIIGIEILSEDAASLAGEATLIVANKMSAMDIMSAIHPHPTLCESFGKLAQKIFMGMMIQKKQNREKEERL